MTLPHRSSPPSNIAICTRSNTVIAQFYFTVHAIDYLETYETQFGALKIWDEIEEIWLTRDDLERRLEREVSKP